MENEKHKTRNAILVVLLFISILALSAVVPARWIGGEKKVVLLPKLDLTLLASPQNVATDRNRDGDISWKEVIDDTLDAPASTLAELQKNKPDPKAIEQLNDPNNLTASFSKNLYLPTAYLKKNNITDEAAKSDALARLVQDEKAKLTKTTYRLSDITIAPSESKQTIQVYGNSMATLLKRTVSKEIVTKELTSVIAYSETKDASTLVELAKSVERLDSIIQKMKTMPVPISAASYHLLALSRVADYREVVFNLSKIESDPIRASFVIDSYTESTALIFKLYQQLSAYFKLSNVTFTSQDPGYVFIVGYTLE